ncbi:RDD family protein [Streptomyces sanyensis]|uniref:RDD family protein n=1 Tax=Streptomyces sanyensis TaxID=568869 RepID=UPI003D7709A4
MSAPTPATGDGSPAPGYYPDPSIPGYVRYWNGAAWVPGTSRPAPAQGEELSAPPGAAAAPPPAASAAAPPPARVEETGPVFLDEEPEPEAARPEPASAWQADAARQAGFGGDLDHRVSWGSPAAGDPRRPAEPAADPSGGQLPGMRSGSAPAPEQPAAAREEGPAAAGSGRTPPGAAADGPGAAASVAPSAQRTAAAPPPQAQWPQAPAERQVAAAAPARPGPAAPAPSPLPEQPASPARPVGPVSEGQGGGAASWAQQVHQLAGSGASAAPEGGQPVTPFKPPVDDPFLRAAQAQANARPASPGRRLAARLVDTLLLGALVGAVAVPAGTRAWEHIDAKLEAARLSGETVTVWLLDGTTGTCLGIVLGALLVLGVLYEALPTARWGRTLGKRLCGLTVLDIESHEPPSFGGALRRWLVYSVLGLLVLGVLNVLWCLFDKPWRQCWHDKAARTFVSG